MRRILLYLTLIFIVHGSSVFAAEFTVAVRAHHGEQRAIEQWQSTINYLSETVPKHSFVLMPIVSLQEITRAAENKEFDFLLSNPSSYIEIKQLYGASAIATLNNKRADTAQSRFGSVIFTHVNNTEIQQLPDLLKRRVMAVSETAFGGWRVALSEFLKQGIDPYEDFSSISYSASEIQQEVVNAVLAGKVDAGVVRTDQLERMEARGELDMRYLRILNNRNIRDFPFFLSTDLYPEWAFVALKDVPVNVVDRVATALIALPENSEAARTGRYVSWIKPLDYTPVLELLRQLKVSPFSS